MWNRPSLTTVGTSIKSKHKSVKHNKDSGGGGGDEIHGSPIAAPTSLQHHVITFPSDPRSVQSGHVFHSVRRGGWGRGLDWWGWLVGGGDVDARSAMCYRAFAGNSIPPSLTPPTTPLPTPPSPLHITRAQERFMRREWADGLFTQNGAGPHLSSYSPCS